MKTAGKSTIGAVKAAGRGAVAGMKYDFANRFTNPMRGTGGIKGYLGGAGTYGSGGNGTTATNIVQNDLGVYALSQMLDREFKRIATAAPSTDGNLTTPLDNVPEVAGDNLPYIVRILERNVVLVDQKVQAVGRNVRKTDDLVEHAKKMLDRTNTLIENNTRALSAQRFKELEDKMEQSQAIAALDARVQNEVETQVSALEERLRAEFGNQGGDIISSILGLFGKTVIGPGSTRSMSGALGLLGAVGAGSVVMAPSFAQASNQPNQTLDSLYTNMQQDNAFSRFMGMQNEEGSGDNPNQADYEKLMGRVSNSKTDRATIVSTDLYDLAARAAFISADDLSFSSKRSTSVTSDGTVTITAKQEIVLDAPVIRLNGVVVAGGASSFSQNQGGGEGGDNGTTPSKKKGMWGSDMPEFGRKPSTPEGVSPLNGDETINTTEGGDRVSEAFRYFKSKGWSDEQAAAIVGNYQGESGKDIDFTNNTGDGGAAFGAAQWNRNGSPDRYENFKKLYGKDLTEATWEEQMEFTNWELTSDDPNNRMQKKAGDLLRKATTSSEGALIVSQYYERPNAAYANNQGRIDNADAIMKKKDKYLAEDQNNPILTKNKKTDEATFKGDAPEGYHTGMAPIKMTNDGATRHYDIDPALKQKLQESVYTTYGPGYSVEVYSGGQDAAGRKKLGSSSRHNIDKDGEGQAADVYVIDPNGKRVVGDDLGKLGQYWQAKDYGGTGLEMHGGGIHLDGHTDRAKTWNYGNETKGARQAVAEGVKGKLPDDLHYIQDEKPGWIDDPKTAGVEPKSWGNENSTTLDKPITQADVDAMYGGIYDSPIATANTMGDVIASQPVMPEDLPPKTIATTPTMPSGPKSRKRKNTHDGVNMSAIDMATEADSNS